MEIRENEVQKRTALKIIEANYSRLFPAEQKVADFIVKHPEKSVSANVSELANLSNVSDATVIRMCKHLGFRGHYQLRLQLAWDLGHQDGMSLDPPSDTASEVFGSFAKQLAELGKTIEGGKLAECVRLINEACYVHVVAVGNTSPFSQYLGFRLERLGIRCTYNAIPEYFINHINLASQGDLVVAISQSGTSKQVVQAVELAKRKGLKIVVITAHEYSPLSRLADCLLVSSTEDPWFGDYRSSSRLNEMAMIDALIHFVASQGGVTDNSTDSPELLFSEYKL